MRKQKELSQNSIRRAVIEVEGKLQKKIDTLQSHLAGINCAAEGNSLGRREANTNSNFFTNNEVKYVNDETGEVTKQIPKVIKFAIAMQKAKRIEKYVVECESAQKKTAEVETEKRRLQTLMNQYHREAAVSGKSVREWKSTAFNIFNAVKG